MPRKKRDARGEIFSRSSQKRKVPFGEAVASGELKEQVESFNDVRGELESMQEKAADFVAKSCEETEPLDFKHTHTVSVHDGIRTFIVPADVDEALFDAIELTHSIQAVILNAESFDGDPRAWMIARHAMNVGVGQATLFARGFEDNALVGRKRKEQARGLKLQRNRKDLHREAVTALTQAQIDFPNRGTTVQKSRAAESLGISLSAFYDRLKFG